jgi:hypothetical protein
MDSLPLEISQYVLLLACHHDGGHTACRLSLVSRRFRILLTPIRWRIVAVSGPSALASFAAMVSARDEGPPPVENLLISDERKLSGLPQSWTQTTTHSSGWPFSSLSPAAAYEENTRAVLALLQSVLSVLAATLQRLCLVLAVTPDSMLVPVPLPALTELACWFYGAEVRMPAPPPAVLGDPAAYETWRAAAQARLPALRRLHAVNALVDPWCFPFLMQCLPRELTHLRFSNRANAQRLLALLSAPAWDAGWAPVLAVSRAWIPPALQRIVVHPRPGSFDSRASALQDNLGRWRDSASTGEDLTALVVVDYNGQREYTFKQAYEDWLDAATGGPGCWSESGWLLAQPQFIRRQFGGTLHPIHRALMTPDRRADSNCQGLMNVNKRNLLAQRSRFKVQGSMLTFNAWCLCHIYIYI